MKTYRHDEAPLKIFGVPFFEEQKKLKRLPKEVCMASENLTRFPVLGERVPGARLCFRTNAPEFSVTITYEGHEVDHGMSIWQAHSGLVFVGDRPTSRYMGPVYPESYEALTATRTFQKSNDMEDVTIFLPRNPVVTGMSIEVPDDAEVLPPTPYRYPKPILYYGTSITEGGCTMISNGYNSLISRWLDVDFYNLGLSGSAMGEPEIAHYINTIEKSIFVYDYDQNASLERLKETHEPFFKIIREHDPNLPVVMMTCPNFWVAKDAVERREVVRRTYENAFAAGDKNVYFIDGETCFGGLDLAICTIDTIHPNALGFYEIAKTVYPVIKKILEEQK